MLPLNHLTPQDKRAFYLYFAVALLCAVGLAVTMFFISDSPAFRKTGPKTERLSQSPESNNQR